LPDAPCRKGGVGWGVATTDSGIVFSQNASGDVLVNGSRAGSRRSGWLRVPSASTIRKPFRPAVVYIMFVSPIDPFEFAFEASGA
jgi:hypothetical protein